MIHGQKSTESLLSVHFMNLHSVTLKCIGKRSAFNQQPHVCTGRVTEVGVKCCYTHEFGTTYELVLLARC